MPHEPPTEQPPGDGWFEALLARARALDEHERTSRKLEARAAEVEAEVACRSDELASLRARLASVVRPAAPITDSDHDRRVTDLEAEVDALRASASWRVTAPLRAGWDALRRLRARRSDGCR